MKSNNIFYINLKRIFLSRIAFFLTVCLIMSLMRKLELRAAQANQPNRSSKITHGSENPPIQERNNEERNSKQVPNNTISNNDTSEAKNICQFQLSFTPKNAGKDVSSPRIFEICPEPISIDFKCLLSSEKPAKNTTRNLAKRSNSDNAIYTNSQKLRNDYLMRNTDKNMLIELNGSIKLRENSYKRIFIIENKWKKNISNVKLNFFKDITHTAAERVDEQEKAMNKLDIDRKKNPLVFNQEEKCKEKQKIEIKKIINKTLNGYFTNPIEYEKAIKTFELRMRKKLRSIGKINFSVWNLKGWIDYRLYFALPEMESIKYFISIIGSFVECYTVLILIGDKNDFFLGYFMVTFVRCENESNFKELEKYIFN